MKRFAPVLVLVLIVSFLAPALFAATAAKPATASVDKSPGSPVAAAITTVTGIAISPLLGTGGYGAYQYFRADSAAKASLPWYAKPTFWLPALVIVGLIAAKDAFGAVIPPGFKKPIDVLETIESKATGLVAAGAVVPFTMDALSKMLVAQLGPDASHGVVTTGLAMLPLASIDLTWLLNILTVPFGIAMFAIVWMASHAINVLILLSPWGAIDAALKGMRTGLLGLLTITATMNPWVAAGLSLVVIIVAYFVAGWAFRLTVFGSEFCWDFFTLRRTRFKLSAAGNKMFSSDLMTKKGVPMRTYGKLINEPENGRWKFVYKPWLFLPERSVEVLPVKPEVGSGLFISSIRDGDLTLFILPPRYRGHEEQVVQIYAIEGGVKPAGLRKAWSAMRELFGGSAAKTQIA